MKPKIAIIYTTFLRDELMYKTIQSILDNWQDDYVLLIGDQSWKFNKEKESIINNPKTHYFILPFDCGVSYARNFLVQKAQELGCEYCFLTADSLQFIEKYDLTPIIEFLGQGTYKGIVGFDIENRITWEADLILIEGDCFLLDIPRREKIKFKGIDFQPLDICKNFFLAKTECLIENKWDNDLKLGEHEDFAYRLKQTKWKIFYTDYIKAKYSEYKKGEYQIYRNRLYSKFIPLLKQKYNLKNWVRYTEDLKRKFREYKRKIK